MRYEELVRELELSGQEHIARHMDRLGPGLRERLAGQLEKFDYGVVRELVALARSARSGCCLEEFEPAPVTLAWRAAREVAAARKAGEAALRGGAVAAFCVAGGQGSRLRFAGPKGCYQIGAVSGRSLFQVHAEKVLAAGRRYLARIPFYVMTSETNDGEVRGFFEFNDFFGLDRADVFFCVQRMLPAFDGDGRFLLDAPEHVFVNPDGHGGAFFALESSGALDDMARRGVRCISYFQVDNPLVPVLDPVFIGEHIRTGAEMSSKVLRKREPLEKLGVFGIVGGGLRVVEYSEMSETLQKSTLADGSLRYAFGSIAVHVLDVDFARRMARGGVLAFHAARKRVPCLGSDGRVVEPEEPNAVKFERFVFDAIPHARNPLVLEVLREEEFAPVKNFAGEDSPETACAAMMALHRRWLKQAGLDVPGDLAVEISPLFALDADELRARVGGIEIREGLYLDGAAGPR